mgnify:FL=1
MRVTDPYWSLFISINSTISSINKMINPIHSSELPASDEECFSVYTHKLDNRILTRLRFKLITKLFCKKIDSRITNKQVE